MQEWVLSRGDTIYAITSTQNVIHKHTHLYAPLNQIFLSFSSGPFHRDRRRYLRTALMELNQLLSDSPGLLGPKVSVYTNVVHVYLVQLELTL